MGRDNQWIKLKKAGCTDISGYCLVNNYGYTFSKGGVEYDLRYWENCYGVYGGGWHVDTVSGNPLVVTKRCPYFGENFDGIVEWIKNNL